MDARHCAGASMHELMAYGASVGSNKAKKEHKVEDCRNYCDSTAHFFGKKKDWNYATCFIGFANLLSKLLNYFMIHIHRMI